MSMSTKNIRRGRSCVFLLHVHLVFVTKYRKNVFTRPILMELEKIFASVCRDFNAKLIEFNGENDHVHLLLNYPPKISLSSLINSLKGVSSRLIRRKGYNSIQKALWGNNLWSPSYFASSCGGAPLKILEQYIQQQKLLDPEIDQCL
jgi:putative transposase